MCTNGFRIDLFDVIEWYWYCCYWYVETINDGFLLIYLM